VGDKKVTTLLPVTPSRYAGRSSTSTSTVTSDEYVPSHLSVLLLNDLTRHSHKVFRLVLNSISQRRHQLSAPLASLVPTVDESSSVKRGTHLQKVSGIEESRRE
jgi:hypothetical protein